VPILLLLTLTTACHPLRGVVLDSSGAPVPQATVTIEAPGHEGRRVQTGGDGRFVFVDLSVGETLVLVSAPASLLPACGWPYFVAVENLFEVEYDVGRDARPHGRLAADGAGRFALLLAVAQESEGRGW